MQRQNRSIDPEVWHRHAWRNLSHSLILLATMAGMLGLLGYLLWGKSGLVLLLCAGLAAVTLNSTISPRLVMRLYRARPITAQESPMLWQIIGSLCERAGLERPATPYYIPSRLLNAFAVGSPSQAAIGLTDGLLRQLDIRQLTAVLAHEISHIRANDIWVIGLADTFSRTTSLLSLLGQLMLLVNLPLLFFAEVQVNWLAVLLLLFAPNICALAQLALSRTREFDADLNAARLTGDPEGLALALAQIENLQGNWFERILLPGRRVPEPSILRTHPAARERIERLMDLKPRYTRIPDLFTIAGHLADHGRLPGSHVRRRPRWHMTGLWH